MTRLDCHRLHSHLTDRIATARRYHTEATDPGDRGRLDQHITALVAVDGWLRRQAADQLHERGTTVHPTGLIASGRVRVDVDEYLEMLDSEMERHHGWEHRVKTLRGLANEAPQWAVQPDPFPESLTVPARRGLWRRLVGAR